MAAVTGGLTGAEAVAMGSVNDHSPSANGDTNGVVEDSAAQPNLDSVHEAVEKCNALLEKLQIAARVTRVEECTASMFVALFEALFGTRLEGVIRRPQRLGDHIRNAQLVIDTLAETVLQFSLQHITGDLICAGDAGAIANLIEIMDEISNILQVGGTRETTAPVHSSLDGATTSPGSPAAVDGSDGVAPSPQQQEDRSASQPRSRRSNLNRKAGRGRRPGTGAGDENNQRGRPQGRRRSGRPGSGQPKRGGPPSRRPTQQRRRRRRRPDTAPAAAASRDPLLELNAMEDARVSRGDDLDRLANEIRTRERVLREYELLQRKAELDRQAAVADKRAARAEKRHARATRDLSKVRQQTAVAVTARTRAPPPDEEDIHISEELMVALGVPTRVARHLMAKQRRLWEGEVKAVPAVLRDRDLEEAQRRQEALQKIFVKEHVHNQRLDDTKARSAARIRTKNARRQARTLKIRAAQHEEERARLWKSNALRKRDHDERVYTALFDRILRLQKQRLIDERRAARREHEENMADRRVRMEALENYYRDQEDMLREDLAEENRRRAVEERAQTAALSAFEREARASMASKLEALRDRIDANYSKDMALESEERLMERVTRLAKVK